MQWTSRVVRHPLHSPCPALAVQKYQKCQGWLDCNFCWEKPGLLELGSIPVVKTLSYLLHQCIVAVEYVMLWHVFHVLQSSLSGEASKAFSTHCAAKPMLIAEKLLQTWNRHDTSWQWNILPPGLIEKHQHLERCWLRQYIGQRRFRKFCVDSLLI